MSSPRAPSPTKDQSSSAGEPDGRITRLLGQTIEVADPPGQRPPGWRGTDGADATAARIRPARDGDQLRATRGCAQRRHRRRKAVIDWFRGGVLGDEPAAEPLVVGLVAARPAPDRWRCATPARPAMPMSVAGSALDRFEPQRHGAVGEVDRRRAATGRRVRGVRADRSGRRGSRAARSSRPIGSCDARPVRRTVAVRRDHLAHRAHHRPRRPGRSIP